MDLERYVVSVFIEKGSSYKTINLEEAKLTYPSLDVNERNQTWTCAENPRRKYGSSGVRIEAIGKARLIEKDQMTGIIGIYDKTRENYQEIIEKDWREINEGHQLS